MQNQRLITDSATIDECPLADEERARACECVESEEILLKIMCCFCCYYCSTCGATTTCIYMKSMKTQSQFAETKARSNNKTDSK